MKIAYENWHKAVEYDGKLLNCLPVAEKEIKGLPKPKMVTAPTAQNHQQLHNQNNRQTVQCHQNAITYSPLPQPVEYPQFVQQHCSQLLPSLPSNVQEYNSRPMESSNAYNGEDWCRPRTGQGLEDIFSEEIRLRSSEMLETDDMQRLLKTFGIGMNTMGTTQGGFGQTDESCYGYNMPYQAQIDNTYRRERNRGSGKAVVGWLKLKAALRWGIFIRKKAAERRPQIVEIE